MSALQTEKNLASPESLVVQCRPRGGHAAEGLVAIKPLNELTATEIVAAIGRAAPPAKRSCAHASNASPRASGEVHAWAYFDADAALAAARAFDKSGKRGPLAGVPFGVKDIIDTLDMPTEWGTPIHRGRQPERDAACVALSRKAGGVSAGQDRHHRVREPASRPDPQSA